MNENRQVIITLNIYSLYIYNIPIHIYVCNEHTRYIFFRSIVVNSLGQKKILSFILFYGNTGNVENYPAQQNTLAYTHVQNEITLFASMHFDF